MSIKKIIFLKFLIITFSGILLVSFLVHAWSPPPSSPPDPNVSPPINTGDEPQSKVGDLNIGGGLKYWITKSGDSFALKNNAGIIKFILGQDGKVGIGAMDPENELEVEGDIGLKNYSTTDGEPRAVYVYGHKGTGAQYGMHLGRANNRWRTRIFAPTGRDITFGFHNSALTNPTQADWSEKMIIRDNGNVGIGVDPSYRLHVNGRAKFDGSTAGMWIEAGGNDWFIGRSGTGGSNLRIWNNNKNRITLEPDGDIIFEIGN